MGNVLGDLFYPDNPKRRAKVLQLTQRIADYMKQNFRATNHLTKFLQANNVEEVRDLKPISVDMNQTLKYNSKRLQDRIILIQSVIEPAWAFIRATGAWASTIFFIRSCWWLWWSFMHIVLSWFPQNGAERFVSKSLDVSHRCKPHRWIH